MHARCPQEVFLRPNISDVMQNSNQNLQTSLKNSKKIDVVFDDRNKVVDTKEKDKPHVFKLQSDF